MEDGERSIHYLLQSQHFFRKGSQLNLGLICHQNLDLLANFVFNAAVTYTLVFLRTDRQILSLALAQLGCVRKIRIIYKYDYDLIHYIYPLKTVEKEHIRAQAALLSLPMLTLGA